MKLAISGGSKTPTRVSPAQRSGDRAPRITPHHPTANVSLAHDRAVRTATKAQTAEIKTQRSIEAAALSQPPSALARTRAMQTAQSALAADIKTQTAWAPALALSQPPSALAVARGQRTANMATFGNPTGSVAATVRSKTTSVSRTKPITTTPTKANAKPKPVTPPTPVKVSASPKLPGINLYPTFDLTLPQQQTPNTPSSDMSGLPTPQTSGGLDLTSLLPILLIAGAILAGVYLYSHRKYSHRKRG